MLPLPQFRTRRILIILCIVLSLALVIHLVAKAVAFAQLFGVFRPHSGIRITQQQVADAYNNTANTQGKKPVIPKILHQIFHNWKDPGNATLPDHWAAARQSCVDLNPDWEVKQWNMEDSRTFLEDEFPWFVETYDGYKFNIQRVDVMRYFLIRHYGGIYMDMDNGCAANLDPITYLPAFTTDGDMGALSNNIMGGQPDHPWFHLLTENLIPYNWNWYFPYVIISWTSGQWFVTAMFEKYHALLQKDGTVRGFEDKGPHFSQLHHLLMSGKPNHDPWVFFTQVRGGTWSNWDSGFFPWLGDHLPRVILTGVGIGLVVILTCCFGCRWCARRCSNRKSGYKQVPHADEP